MGAACSRGRLVFVDIRGLQVRAYESSGRSAQAHGRAGVPARSEVPKVEVSMNKLLSGRFIWCLVSALVFLILSVNRILPADKVTEIVLVIVMAYFGKDRTTPNKEA